MATETSSVLVVDDDASIRRLTSRMLAMLSLTVREAANGHEALQQVSSEDAAPIRVVLLDYRLPDISGQELAMWMRERDPRVRVIYFTGSSQADLPSEELEREDTFFLGKPFSLDALKSVLQRAGALV